MKSVDMTKLLDNVINEEMNEGSLSSNNPEDMIRYIRLYLSHTGQDSTNSDIKDVVDRLYIEASSKQKEVLKKALLLTEKRREQVP